ncbi:MAG: sugar ABC transporter substrate-binding protein [Christensenellaceae bacterium]|nr:sugar ABC transporter substrate-binding protein [Christensenellaceae bacterium]
MKKVISIILATILILSVAVFGVAEEAPKYKIGFSPYTLTNEYFTAVLNGVKAACEESGHEMVFFDPQNDPTKQATQIDDMIADGINALVYIPYDSAGCRNVLQTCRDKGVKVINIDNVITEDDYDLVDAIIASDNTQLGYLSGQWVAENYPDGANILIVHLQTAESCHINVKGFWDGIKENVSNPDAFKEVAVVEGGGATDVAFNVVTDALQANEDINVIYAINDTSALGAVQAVKEAGKIDAISILGKDGAPIGKHAIKEGSMVQSSAQRPTYMGYLGVITAVDLLNGKEIEFNTSIPSYSITKDNIDDFDLDAWDALP